MFLAYVPHTFPTALTYTVNHREKEMAKILIENGANVNTTSSILKTPLHFALVPHSKPYLEQKKYLKLSFWLVKVLPINKEKLNFLKFFNGLISSYRLTVSCAAKAG